jgi:hypothetical protein
MDKSFADTFTIYIILLLFNHLEGVLNYTEPIMGFFMLSVHATSGKTGGHSYSSHLDLCFVQLSARLPDGQVSM